MEDTDITKDLQSLQKTIARANNARLPLEGDFHVSYLCSPIWNYVSGHHTHGAWLRAGTLPSLPRLAKALQQALFRLRPRQ